MYCLKCGKKIPDEATFCPECGAKIPRSASDEPKQRKSDRLQSSRPSGGGGLKIILVAVLAGAGVYFGKPVIDRMLDGKKEEPVSVVTPVQEGSSQNVSPVSGKTENQAVLSAEPENNAVPGPSSNETVPQQNTEPVTDNNDTDGHGTWEEGTMPQSLDYLTETLFDDFIYPERLLSRGLPEQAERIELYDARGAWKYELILRDGDFKEIGACTLDFGQYAVLFDLYPTQYVFSQELYHTSREESGYQTYSGTMDSDMFSFQAPDKSSTIVLGSFAQIEGTQFGFGSMVGYNGDILDVLLVRP